MPSLPTQNHIHLDFIEDGGPDNGPEMRWKATERAVIPSVQMTIKRGITGKLLPYVQTFENNPNLKIDYSYILRIDDYWGSSTEGRLMTLQSWLGNRVYLIDFKHPNDGINHNPFIRKVFVASVGPAAKFDYALQRYYVNVDLIADDQ